MFENRFYKASREYLEKSKNIFYNDPELHFLFAKYYIKTREYEKADFANFSSACCGAAFCVI